MSKFLILSLLVVGFVLIAAVRPIDDMLVAAGEAGQPLALLLLAPIVELAGGLLLFFAAHRVFTQQLLRRSGSSRLFFATSRRLQ